MLKKQTLRFLQSLVFVPLMATVINAGPIGSNRTDDTNIALSSQSNNISQAINSGALSILENSRFFTQDALTAMRAKKIDVYFRGRGLPLAGFGRKMVQEAARNGIDWRIMPAIAMRESTGGKFACETASFNPFGWGSCKISFKSYDEAIETIARNLGGNNSKTASYYDGELTEVLDNYNGRAVDGYSDQVIAIMKKISPSA
jgi:hypothetical protein